MGGEDGGVITVEQARRLRKAGALWVPGAGDRFVVPDRDMDDDVFVVSDMTVEVHDYPGGKVIGFNGTTEWALDSVTLDTALWMPREDQLRALLGDRFVGLHRDGDEWMVQVEDEGGQGTFRDPDPECAYALALLSVV